MKKHNAEILLGLRCCTTKGKFTCPNCPYDDDNNCKDKLISDAFSMITNLLVVIEKRYKEEKK